MLVKELLLDRNLLGLMSIYLRNHDRKNTVVHFGADLAAVDTAWKGEDPRELANAAFGQPCFRLLGVLLLRCVASFRSQSSLPLNLAEDVQRLGIRELDVDIVLLQPRKLPVEFVSIFGLVDVELWLPFGVISASLAHICVEFFKEMEERWEWAVNSVAVREKCHCVPSRISSF